MYPILQYSLRSFLAYNSSPLKVLFTIERNVEDAIPPSLILRSLYDSSGTKSWNTFLIE